MTAYLSGQPDLIHSMGRYWRTLKSVADSGDLNAAVQIDGPWMAARWRLGQQEADYEPLGPVDMADPETLSGFLQWRGPQTGNRRLLIIAGHGTGLATLEQSRSGVMADGGSGQVLDAAAVAGVLDAQDVHFDVISLDSCHGASLEVAWELRRGCSYCVAPPAKLPTPGLPWAETLGADPVSTPIQAVRMLQQYYDGPVGVVDCRVLGEVRDAFKSLVDALEADMEANIPALRFIRSRTTSWGYRDEACDALELTRRLARNAGTVEAANAASVAARALNAACVTSGGGEGDQPGRGKVGLFFPPGWENPPEWYHRAYSFARETGWARFLQKYHETVELDPAPGLDRTSRDEHIP